MIGNEPKLDDLFHDFRRRYYQLVPAREFDLSRWVISKDDSTEDAQRDVLDKILCNESLPVPVEYKRSIVKLLLTKLSEPLEELHGVYASLVVDGQAVEVPETNILGRQCTLFSPPAPQAQTQVRYFYAENDFIEMVESPSIIAAEGATGHRTWEASLALASWILKSPEMIRAKTVIELGAGSGFLSILCAKSEAQHVTATDGSESMLYKLRRNVEANKVSETVACEVLRFGEEHDSCYDVILGADVTYEESISTSLAKTLAILLVNQPIATVIIAATIRRSSRYGVEGHR